MAAVHAAAAQAGKEPGSPTPQGVEAATPVMQSAAPAAAAGKERERLVERLRGVCQGGSVVPVPFLRAAHAVPAAILDDMRAPYLPPSHAHAPLVILHSPQRRPPAHPIPVMSLVQHLSTQQ